jgi:hypothetical protein
MDRFLLALLAFVVVAVLFVGGAGGAGMAEYGEAMGRAREAEAAASIEITRINADMAISLAAIRAEIDTLTLVIGSLQQERERADQQMMMLIGAVFVVVVLFVVRPK